MRCGQSKWAWFCEGIGTSGLCQHKFRGIGHKGGGGGGGGGGQTCELLVWLLVSTESSQAAIIMTVLCMCLAGHTLSQERVWYVTVQLIVLADSGCRVYMRSHSTQTT